ncbi:hypothetical protein FRB99_001506 [Tulasnella sp. 403]|nr:hypothetical protein FRB99_001506 [Tulasnella sp. 403]
MQCGNAIVHRDHNAPESVTMIKEIRGHDKWSTCPLVTNRASDNTTLRDLGPISNVGSVIIAASSEARNEEFQTQRDPCPLRTRHLWEAPGGYYGELSLALPNPAILTTHAKRTIRPGLPPSLAVTDASLDHPQYTPPAATKSFALLTLPTTSRPPLSPTLVIQPLRVIFVQIHPLRRGLRIYIMVVERGEVVGKFVAPLDAHGLASIIVVQATGRTGKALAFGNDEWQIGILVACACAYVGSATWIVWCYSSIATTPLWSTLLGVALTAFIFLTLIGFAQRRTNVIESSLLALYFAYSVWLCSSDESGGDGHGGYGSEAYWASWVGAGAAAYAPLLQNLVTHLSKLLLFITHTLPKPLLLSLFYRLFILQLASKILPQIGADGWSTDEPGEEKELATMRPSERLTAVLLAYRQTIFVTVYSHLLLLDHSSLVWWRWANVFFTLATWTVEMLLTNDDTDELVGMGGEVVKGWKVE